MIVFINEAMIILKHLMAQIRTRSRSSASTSKLQWVAEESHNDSSFVKLIRKIDFRILNYKW